MTSTARVGTIVGGGATQRRSSGLMAFHIAECDMDRPAPQPVLIPSTFLAHSLARNPTRPEVFVAFEKRGPGCGVYDRAASRVSEIISPTPGRQFYGHGVFSPDGALLYCTESDLHDRERGYIAVRDGRDFRYLGDFPSHGCAPHDCLLRDGGATVVITNGGGVYGSAELAPSVTWVDVKSGKLIHEERTRDKGINAGHLAMTRAGALAVSSAPRQGLASRTTGAISMRGPNGQLTPVRQPRVVTSRMVGETLSIAIHEPTGTVAATNPAGDILTFWRLESGEFLKSLRLPAPRGVALSLDEREVVVTFGKPPRAARINVFSLEPLDKPENRTGYRCGISGSHFSVI